MAGYRRGRINDALKEELSLALREIKDPRVTGAMVSITRAEVTPDLRNAKVFFSVLGGDAREVGKGLKSANGYLRRHLAQTLNLRLTPELTFIEDDSISHGAHIARVLEGLSLSRNEEDKEAGGSESEEDKK